MSYDPADYRPTARGTVAAWVICLGIAGLGLALVTGRGRLTPAACAQPVHGVASAADRCPMAGVRIPRAGPMPGETNPLLGSRLRSVEPAQPRSKFWAGLRTIDRLCQPSLRELTAM